MERSNRGKDAQLLRNQPYDESVEVEDGEDVPSVYSPTPRGRRQPEVLTAMVTSGSRNQQPLRAQGPGRLTQDEEEEDSEEEESDEEEDDDDEDDDDEPTEPLDGAYDPADYANLPVTTEIRELFQYISRYSPQNQELDLCLKPFIPDFIPAVGDIDAFLKVPRPDLRADQLGLLVLDEPSVKQSDPTVLTLWLSEESKQHGTAEMKKVGAVASVRTDPRAVDGWVESIGALHRSKPAARVRYSGTMPDIDGLMQEWPPEVERLLAPGPDSAPRMGPAPASLACDLRRYADIVCCLLDVPVHRSRVQSLHLLFSLYLEFRESQHFSSRP